jgi:8-oxo-dGTP pyrophosphatase MutT (NUDIX family)
MATSTFSTEQYTSSDFVESCGAVLFDLSDPSSKRICLANIINEDKWILVKGRRNINETRKAAALREVFEETGYRAKLLPARMPTRATASNDPHDVPDQPRVQDGLTEPFMCTFRKLAGSAGVKVIWWFVAMLDDVHGERGSGEEEFRIEFFDCKEAEQKLWYETDREVFRNALAIVQGTVGEVV